MTFLAADEREGRGPGTRGSRRRPTTSPCVFKEAGLKPAPGADGYFQPFTISGGPASATTRSWRSTAPTARAIEAVPRPISRPLAIGIGGTLERGPGRLRRLRDHGQDDDRTSSITTTTPAIDVKGKAVLIIRREPRRTRTRPARSTARRTADSPPSSTRRPTPSSTGRPPSSGQRPPSVARTSKDELLRFATPGPSAELEASRS